MNKRSKDLTNGNIKNQLLTLTWPMLMGMIGIVIFNLVDTYFVGMLGVQELAAMSFSFPVVMFLNSIALGIGTGTSSLISRNVMKAERNSIKVMASSAILLGVLVVLLFVIIGLSTIRPLFSALGAENQVLDFVYEYMSIWYLGVPFVVIPMIGNNIVRATGDTFTPGMIMLSSAVINTFLDPLLIFGYGPFPRMGIEGAALATVISRAISLFVILFVLRYKQKLLKYHLGKLSEIISTWKSILYIAGPASLTMLITPISIGFITRIIASFGKEAVAAFGVASRIEMFALMVITSLGSVLIIFVGQNLSKHKFNRIFEALKLSLKFSIIWGLAVFVLLLLFDEAIANIFTDDPKVINIIVNYFYIIGASYGFLGLVMLSTSSFNGLNKPYPSTVFSIIRMLVLFVPLAWIGAKYFDIHGVFWAGLIANIVAGVLSFSYLFKTVKRIEAKYL